MTKNQLKFQKKLDELSEAIELCRQGKLQQRALALALRDFHDKLTRVADGAYLQELDDYEKEVWDVVSDPDRMKSTGNLIRVDQLKQVNASKGICLLPLLDEMCEVADGFFWATEGGYSERHPVMQWDEIPDWATHVFVYIDSK